MILFICLVYHICSRTLLKRKFVFIISKTMEGYEGFVSIFLTITHKSPRTKFYLAIHDIMHILIIFKIK